MDLDLRRLARLEVRRTSGRRAAVRRLEVLLDLLAAEDGMADCGNCGTWTLLIAVGTVRRRGHEFQSMTSEA